MKSASLLVLMLWMYETQAQAPAGQTSEQFATDTNSYPSAITNNICNNLQAGFTHYPLSGLTVQFTNQSTVVGGNISGWLWSFGDTSSSSTQSPSHNYSAPGTYTVCLTVAWDVEGGPTCQDSVCNAVTVSYVAGVEDLSNNDIDIYPNPSNGHLLVRTDVPIESYSIYNDAGEKLDEQKYSGDIIHLPPAIPAGIYFIYLKSYSTTLIKKLLLQYQ